VRREAEKSLTRGDERRSVDTKMRADGGETSISFITLPFTKSMYECKKVLLTDEQQKQLRRKAPSLSGAITLHIPLHYCAHDLPKSWRWNINFPANRPVIMASIQHTTLRMFHPRPGYLLNKKEKQLPTTII